MKAFKKLTAWLCCMALVISFIPATALPVFADEAEAPEIEQIAVTQTQGELPALEANQEYVLSEDLTLEGDLTIHNVIYVTSEVTFDLAGNSIIAGDGANGGIFCLTSDEADLTITDSAEGGKLVSGTSTGTPALNIQKGTATLEAGEITGWTRSGAGGMVFVAAGTFNMAGGKLTASSANYGGAIRAENADAVINMTGGEISGNTATDRAPIWLTKGAAFNMDGGAIKNNVAATYAGAIYIDAASSFTMTDGEISGNVATTKQAGAIDLYGTATITGGTISGNTAQTNGGGICVEKSATLTIDGDVEITDNVAGGVGGGVFLSDLTTFVMNDGYVSGNSAPRGGGISTAEAAPSAVMTINGGTIEGNHASNRGANLYTYDTALTINDVTIGAALYGADMATAAAAGANYQNVQARGGDVVIKGGNLAAFDMGSNVGTKGWGTLAISGNPVIAALYVKADSTPTIGNLSNGASVTLTASSAELTMQDSYIAMEGKTYTYSVPKLPVTGAVAPGEYTLTEDFALNGTLTFAGETVIDLAGKTLSQDKANTVLFSVGATGKLTIKDSVGGGKVQFNTTNGSGATVSGEFVLESGTLTGYFRDGSGALFTVYAGGDFTMTGGSITGNGANAYALMRAEGGDHNITITGGEITGNWNKSGYPMIQIGKAGLAENTLTIGGDAVLAGNAYGGATFAESTLWTASSVVEFTTINTHVVIEDEAVVGYLRADGDQPGEGESKKSSISVSGEAVVAGITWSSSAKTSTEVVELTEGAEVKTYSKSGGGVNHIDETVSDNTYDNTAAAGGTGTDYDKGHVYTYKVPTYAVTVEQVAGGTIEVDVTEGAAGATVTVTATPDEGFELDAILVNGEAIDGNTFAIVAGANEVTAIFVAADAPLPTSGKVASGEYVLAADHVLTNRLQIADEAEVIIDLAGHTISMPDVDTNYFLINAGSKLTIKDSVGTGKVQFKETAVGNPAINVYGEFVLEGGELNGWSRPGKAGGAIYLQENSTFIMTGGLITDCECSGDVVIRSAGGGHTVSITGGTITGNNATGGAIVGIRSATAENPSIVTIGGNAVIAGNTYNGAAYTAAVHELNFYETTLTIEGNATLGQVYNNGANTMDSGAYYSSYNISGAPVIQGLRWNAGAKTPLYINDLLEGASIKTANGGSATEYDETVVATPYGDAELNAADKEFGTLYTWRDPATVYTVTVGEVVNGTVTVDPAEGVYGTTVTVTATANEGYELEAILVNGKAIEGNTFTIGTVDAEVTATFVEAAVATYDVVVIEPLGGSVSVDKNNAAEGETITITATASEGYELVAIKVNGEAIEGNTFVMPAASVQVTAEFAEIVPEGFPTSGTIAAGEYVLTENVQLTGTLSVKGEVVIDLAGYSIFAKQGEGEVISSGIFDLSAAEASLTINDSVGTGKLVACNTNGGSHPAVFVQKGIFTLNAGEVTGWIREGGAGGMIYVLSGATFVMNGGKLTGARSSGDAAIRAAAGSTITIAGGEISGNTATGSTIFTLVDGVNFTMTGGAFKNNTGINGGAMRIAGGNVAITGAEFSGNTATKSGGAIQISSGASLTLTNVAIKDNACTDFSTTSSSIGGGIYVDNGASLTINEGTVVSGNSAVRGGGISAKEGAATATITINGGTIEGNHASNRAANLYSYDGTLTINGGTIGAALYGAEKATAPAAGANFQNVQVRGGVVTVSGGNLAALDLGSNAGANWGTLTITGSPVIGALAVKVGQTVTSIGNLTSGAVINTTDADALTIAENDETVAHTAGTKLYQFAGDLGLADEFVPGATVVLEKDDTVGGGIVLTEAGEYTLDLAGYTLTGNMAPYITIGAGAKLTITDSSAEQTGKIVGLANAANATIVVDGEFVLAGGTLTGAGNSAVKLSKNAVMTMNGGEISGNSAVRGGGVTSGDVTGSNVTFTMTGGTIANNTCIERGANLYFFDPAMVTVSGGTIGAGFQKDGEGNVTEAASGVYNFEIRGGNAAISGGTIDKVFMSKSSVGVQATVTGNPKVAMMDVQGDATVTVGNLTSGARIAVTSNYALKGTEAEGAYDATVSAQARLYRFAGDVKSILFIGNSFSGDTCQYLSAIGGFYGNELDAAYLYVGSQNIRWHAQSLAESLRNEDLNGDGVIGDSRDRVGDGLYTCTGYTGYVTIPDVLDGGRNWDYVVLQQGVEFVGFEGTYNSDVDFLMDYIASVQPGAKVYFNQTWAVDNRSWSTQVNPDAPESVEAGGQWVNSSSYLTQFGGSQAAMYDAILRNTDLFFAGDDARFDVDGWFPIGIAIQTMRANYTDSYLTRDGFHLSYNAGRMIAGLTVYKTLFPETDLSALTAEDMAAMFADTSTNHLKDMFDPTEENVDTLLAAVETAYGYAAADTVPTYGEGTANKLFNPDGAEMGGSEYVAAYENVTEVGQVATNERYATTGAGKIVIFKDGAKIGALDEAWLDEQVADIDLGSRLANINGTYYIQADMQAPQLAVVGSKLYMTFDVKLYGDAQNTIINGGIYLTTSTDGITWTAPVKVSDAPMAYGLTALSDGTLLLSVADTATKVLKLDAAGAVTDTVELDAAIADAAFAEVDTKVWAMTSTGAVYYSTDMGETWTATAITGGAYASVDLVPLGKKGIFVTWADEETFDINYKIWTLDEADAYFGWNNSDVFALAEDYTVATAYSGKTTGGQPASFRITSGKNNTHERVIKTYYVDGGKLQSAERGVIITSNKNLALESSLTINMKMMQTYSDKYGAAYAKILRTYADKDSVWTEVDIAAGLEDGTVKIEGSGSSATYTFPYTGVAAKEMGDEVYLMLLDDEGKQISLLNMFSVEDYAYSQLKKATEKTELATLLVDMLNYGAAAQVYFGGYDVENLVNADLTETQQAWASELVSIDTSMSEGVVAAAVAKTTANVTTASVIELNVKFAITGDLADEISNAAYATVDYTTHMGTVMPTQTIQLSDGTANGMNTKDVKITSLATADIRTIVTVRLHRADGSVIEGTERTNNVSAYIYNQLKKGYDESNNLHIILMRLMQYGDAAYAYKH